MPLAGRVAPGELCAVIEREAFETGFVDIGDGRLAGFRDGLLTEKIGTLVRSELQVAGKEAQT